MIMKKLFILLAVFSGMVNAQSSGVNVVNVAVKTITPITTTVAFTSPPIQNIGQSSHQILVPITLCVSCNFTGQFQINGSFDGINYVAISPIEIFQVTSNTTVRVVGYNSFPYITVTVKFTVIAGTASYSIGYIGNSSPPVVSADSFGLTQSVTVNGLASIIAGGVSQVYVPGFASTSLSIYGFSLFTDATATTAFLMCSPDGTVNDGKIVFNNLGAIRQVVFPASLRAYMTCPYGDSLYYNVAGTPATNLNLTYRSEQ